MFWGKKKVNLAVSASEVRFSYTDKEILKSLSLEIKENKITAIIGKSGSGKSTFLELLSGIISGKYSGKIRILGWFKSFVKSKVGFVPQEVSFIPDLSIGDNIKIIGMNFGVSEKNSLRRANKLLELLKLDEYLNKKPTELSGGQKVRLNIILSLLHDPEIVIMDEPFVGLDFRNRRLLWYFIKMLKKQGKSVILTSHLLTEVQNNVDRVVILKKGKVFFHGKVDSLKSKLKIEYVYEVRFSKVAKEKLKQIQKYCDYYEIKILESYGSHLMFSLASNKKKDNLEKLFAKLNLNFEVVGFREPNLDEIFLTA